jgi:soluble lytic murein transglycosylase-like protein
VLKTTQMTKNDLPIGGFISLKLRPRAESPDSDAFARRFGAAINQDGGSGLSSMSRAIFAAGALLASASLAQAGDHASFSPDLQEPSATMTPAPAPVPVGAMEAPAPSRARGSRRRTRMARGRASRHVAVAIRPSLDADGKPLTIGAIPAPLPPTHENGQVAEAVATLETPPSGAVEAAAPTPEATRSASGPREEAAQTVAALLAKHAFENGVPLALAKAVVRIESRGNAHASNHGALGLMQIKYGTARAVGFAGPAVALFVADINLRYGMKVLGQAYKDAGGDTCGALMRYQSGHLARHMSAANRAYCSRARALMAGGA